MWLSASYLLGSPLCHVINYVQIFVFSLCILLPPKSGWRTPVIVSQNLQWEMINKISPTTFSPLSILVFLGSYRLTMQSCLHPWATCRVFPLFQLSVTVENGKHVKCGVPSVSCISFCLPYLAGRRTSGFVIYTVLYFKYYLAENQYLFCFPRTYYDSCEFFELWKQLSQK